MTAIEILKSIQQDSEGNREKFRELLMDPLIRWDLDEIYSSYQRCNEIEGFPIWILNALSFLVFLTTVEVAPSSEITGDSETIARGKKALKIRKEIIQDPKIGRAHV